MQMEPSRRIALLIDGDNAQASLFPQILAEVSKYGVITIRRVYGDWTTSNLKGWSEVIKIYALKAEQQHSYTSGKNSTDSALIIDAMDILYTAGLDGFCIVSSDSDYTRLATRIREANLFVMGIGRKITPPAFVNACNIFVYTENLKPEKVTTVKAVEKTTKVVPSPKVEKKTSASSTSNTTKSSASASSPSTATTNTKANARFRKLFSQAYDVASKDTEGWINLSALGTSLRQLDPAFDPRSYGHKMLSQLVQARNDFFEIRKETKSGSDTIYIKLKDENSKH